VNIFDVDSLKTMKIRRVWEVGLEAAIL
jgi:hypothetical protein